MFGFVGTSETSVQEYRVNRMSKRAKNKTLRLMLKKSRNLQKEGREREYITRICGCDVAELWMRSIDELGDEIYSRVVDEIYSRLVDEIYSQVWIRSISELLMRSIALIWMRSGRVVDEIYSPVWMRSIAELWTRSIVELGMRCSRVVDEIYLNVLGVHGTRTANAEVTKLQS
jgi:hypothetical protein